MIGKACLASHYASAAQTHGTGEAGLGRDAAFASNVAVVANLHLGVDMASRTDERRVEQAGGDIAERPKMHALFQNDSGMMGEDSEAVDVRN